VVILSVSFHLGSTSSLTSKLERCIELAVCRNLLIIYCTVILVAEVELFVTRAKVS
jgi:hypothetical protein